MDQGESQPTNTNPSKRARLNMHTVHSKFVPDMPTITEHYQHPPDTNEHSIQELIAMLYEHVSRTPGQLRQSGKGFRETLAKLAQSITLTTTESESVQCLNAITFILSRGSDKDSRDKNHIQHYLGAAQTHCKTKRAIIHLLARLGQNEHAPKLLSDIIKCLTVAMLNGQGETRVESAAHTAFNNILRRHGTHAASIFIETVMKMRTEGVFKKDDRIEEMIIRRALNVIDKPKFGTNQWRNIRLLMEDCRVNPEDTMWKPDVHGRTVWTTADPPRFSWDHKENLKMTTSNQNGIRANWKDGTVMDFIQSHNSDVIHFTETKAITSLLDRPWEFWSCVQALGYHQCIITSCTGATGKGNYGTMVLSKYLITDLQYSVGDDATDRDARIIRGLIGGRPIIMCYVPCSTRKVQVCQRRVTFDKNLLTTALRLKDETGMTPIIFGDMNVAPRPKLDSTISHDKETGFEFPSCRQHERTALKTLMTKVGLADAFAIANPDAPHKAGHTWRQAKSDYSQTNMTTDHRPASMRVDLMLIPADWLDDSATIGVRLCSVTQDNKNTDHSPLHIKLFRRSHAYVAERKSTAKAILNQIGRLERKEQTSILDTNGKPMRLTTNFSIRLDAHAKRERTRQILEANEHGTHSQPQPLVPEDMTMRDMMETCIHYYEDECLQDVLTDTEETPHYSPPLDESKKTPDGTTSGTAKRAELLRLRRSQIQQHDIFDTRCPKAFLKFSANGHKGTRVTSRQTLFDTGATHSFISKATADDLGLEITGEPESIGMGNASQTESCGDARAFIHAGGKKVPWTFMVLKHMQQSAIIGIDFMKAHDAIIYVKSERIQFTWRTGGTHTVDCGIGLDDDCDDADDNTMDESLELLEVMADKTVKIPKGSFIRMPVSFDKTLPRLQNMVRDEEWGIIHDAGSGTGIVPRGITQVTKGGQQSVQISNFGEKEIEIKKGDIVGLYQTLKPNSFEVKQTKDGSPTAEVAGTDDQFTGMSNQAIDREIAKLEHLKGIPLLQGDHANITEDELYQLKRLVLKHNKLWCKTHQGTPVKPNITCKITLTKEFIGQGGTRPMNPAQRKAFSKIINEQLDLGILEKSTAAVSSTVFLVPKPGGTDFRVVQDYRALNKCIKDDAYPLPLVEEQLAAIGKCKYFSSLDLVAAFWQVELEEDSRDLTSFRTPSGLYRFTRLPMGLKTASGVFCRYLDNILGSLRYEDVLSYLDDVLIASATFERHISSLDKVLTKMSEAGLTLGVKKTILAESETKFLGHVVDENGLRPDPKKLQAVRDMAVPSTATELRGAIGLLSYYRKFIPNFTKIAEPLRQMLQDTARWKRKVEWSATELAALNELRERLLQDATLDHPNWDYPYEVHTDASISGVSAILTQKIDNREHVVSFASRCLTKAEKSYTIPELEALAMLWSAHLFRLYLTGTKFTFVTDSQAAKYILETESEKTGVRLLRWRLALQSYDFDIRHRKGSCNQNADYLSRYPIPDSDPYDCGPTKLAQFFLKDQNNTRAVRLNTLVRKGKSAYFPPEDHSAQTREEWIEQQTDDDFCKKIVESMKSSDKATKARYNHRFSIRNGLLCKTVHNNPNDGGGLIRGPDSRRSTREAQIVVPETLKSFILHQYHSAPAAGHMGRQKVEASIRRSYYWNGLHADLRRYLKACLVCQKNKSTRPTHNGVPQVMTQAQRPWHTLSIDLVTANEETLDNGGYKYILTAIDIFTRYVIAIPLKDKKATTVAKALFRDIFAKHGRPIRIHSDRGKEFINRGLLSLYKTWGIQSASTGGYQPQSVVVERFHKFLNSCMQAFKKHHEGGWSSYCAAITWVYNSSACLATGGYSPYQLAHGTDPTLLQDLDILETNREASSATPRDYYRRTSERMLAMYKIVRTQQAELAERNRKRAELKATDVHFKVNDLVLLWEPAQTHKVRLPDSTMHSAQGTPSKWTSKFTGPHKITQVSPAGPGGGHRYHIEHLKRGPLEVHPNKLHLFNPWSDEQPSTAPDEGDDRVYQTGSYAPDGALFLIPLEKPFAFGIGKVTRTDEHGRVYFQWMGNNKNTPRGTYKKGWLRPDGELYYDDKPRHKSHEPYYEIQLMINQSDIICHSFHLTPTGRLGSWVIEYASEHDDIWWTGKRAS